MLALLRSQPQLVPIVIVVFCVMMGMGMMVPVLPLFTEHHGGGPASAGLLLSAFGAARLVVNIPAGLASERFGRRRVMIAGIALLALASFAAAVSGSIAALAGWLFLQGAGSSLYVTAAMAAVADLSDPTNRGRIMSLYQGAVLVGISLGPAIGGILAGAFGASAPFVTQGMLAVLGAASAALLVSETKGAAAEHRVEAGPAKSRWSLLSQAPFVAVCLVMFATFVARTVTNWQLVPLMVRERFGFGPELVGLLLTAGSLANFSVLPVVGRAIDQWGGRLSIVLGSAITVVALLVLAFGQIETTIWVGIACLGAAGGIMAPACSAFAIEVSPVGHGSTIGTLRMAGDLGLVIGPSVLGWVLSGTGMSQTGGLLLVAALVLGIAAYFGVASGQGR
jgi:DHA1 family multidrug resistance protein-like MFS transporter